MTDLSMHILAAEWVRVIRGKRPQTVVSRRLGYRSNIVYRWEAGVCFPTAGSALRLVELTGGDARKALKEFFHGSLQWDDIVDICSPEGVARLIRELRGRIPVQELANATGISRFAISRWLNGRSQPNLPELFLVVEKTSLRLLDFVAAFTEPSRVPSLARAWSHLVQSRIAAYEYPWSHAILRTIELNDYRKLPAHETGWIAARLGISTSIERECLDLLGRCNQITWTGRHYVPSGTSFVDTRTNPERAKALKAWWVGICLERMQAGATGLFAYNLCSLSTADLARIENLQRKHYRHIAHIIQHSSGSDHVVLYNTQILRLDAPVSAAPHQTTVQGSPRDRDSSEPSPD